jgi:glutaredoxin
MKAAWVSFVLMERLFFFEEGDGMGNKILFSRANPIIPTKMKRPVEERQQFTGSVEMYVTSWCPACKAALAYVKNNGINYSAYDIEKDADAKRRFEEFSGRGVPLIVVGDKTMRGFNSQTLEQWLGRQ